MRKMIDSERKKHELNTENLNLERECNELFKEVEELDNKISSTKISE